MWKCVLLILCTCAIMVQGQDERLAVTIAQGVVVGQMDPGGGLYIFYNIPYATAPTGTDRFKAPLPPPVFLSQFVAVDRGIICPQPSGASNELNMQEDCLVANVFVPEAVATNLPVLVVIHGGAYQFGYGEQEKFRELAKTKGLIVVTFNYRLGVHGFLCLGTEGAPGNAGLKDQVALLRWVNTNIASFGGNPDDVTLAACSAGSGSVDFLTISTITKGLFKKAIMESGVSTGAVGPQIDPIENAINYAKLLGWHDAEDLSSLEDFYKTSTFQELLSRPDAIANQPDVSIRFSPCVENDIGQERVVFNSPFTILKEGNYTEIPLLYGFTNMDGAMRLSFFDTWKDKMNEKFSDFLPAELHFETEDIKEEVAERVKDFYFGGSAVGQDNIRAYIKYFTDVLFAYPMLRSLSTRVEARGDKIHLFEYSFVDENSSPFLNTDIVGASHCHQFFAVMDEGDLTGKTDEYKKMKETLREYWHSFILTGSPSSNDPEIPEWLPAKANRAPHMSLGPTKVLKDDILDDRAAFWDAIYEEHYRGPKMADATTPASTPTTTETTSYQSTADTTTTTSEPTVATSEQPATDSTTTETPTTPAPGSGSVISISNVMFAVVSLSFYFYSY